MWAAIGAQVLGTVMSFSAQQQAADAAEAQGIAQKQAADYQAKSAEIKAGQERAAAQRNAIAERRKENLVLSRSQALAAASGGGAADPSVLNTEGTVVREGELNALNALYHGEEAGRGLEEGAGLARYEGNASAIGASARASAMRTASYGSLLSGLGSAGSFYYKYGSGGSPSVNPNATTTDLYGGSAQWGD